MVELFVLAKLVPDTPVKPVRIIPKLSLELRDFLIQKISELIEVILQN